MKRSRLPLLVLAALLLATSALEGCRTFTSNPGTMLTIANHAATTIKSVEVNYPGGVVGVPEIAAGQSFSKWVPTRGCNLRVRFLDASNKEQPLKEVDLGKTCPGAVTIDVAADYSITARSTQ